MSYQCAGLLLRSLMELRNENGDTIETAPVIPHLCHVTVQLVTSPSHPNIFRLFWNQELPQCTPNNQIPTGHVPTRWPSIVYPSSVTHTKHGEKIVATFITLNSQDEVCCDNYRLHHWCPGFFGP